MSKFHKLFCCHAFEYVLAYNEVSWAKADVKYSEDHKNPNKKCWRALGDVFETLQGAD